MFDKNYQIILMNYPDGHRITHYDSTIIPMVNDIIIDDQDADLENTVREEYIVIKRHFSISNHKVVLLVQLYEDHDEKNDDEDN